MTVTADTAALRKARGAFFTPPAIARYVTDWAVRSADDRVLEPSCGEAAFLLSAVDRLAELRAESGLLALPDLHGVELHEASAASARELLREAGAEADVQVGDFFTFEPDARYDGTTRRNSTFDNAFPRLRLFTGRFDPAGREEQYERLFVLLVDATPFAATWECYEVDKPGVQVPLSEAIDDLIVMLGERNFDSYETYDEPDGKYLRKLGR